MLESHSKYWYGGSLNRKASYPNLLKKDLKSYSKNKFESIYQSYHEYYDNLYWEYEKNCEYNNGKGLCLGWTSIKQCKDWFEQEPYSVKEILKEIKS